MRNAVKSFGVREGSSLTVDEHGFLTGMFYRCVNMTDCDLTGLDTSNATSMRRMFFECNSLRNLTSLYTPVCDFWAIYDNNAADEKVRKIASGERDKIIRIEDPLAYQKIVNYERD